MSKKATKKIDKPFDTKPPKGKCHVHIIVAVPPKGSAGVYHAHARDSSEYAANQALGYAYSQGYDLEAEIHHVVLELPEVKQKVLPKAKPKKVTKLENPAAAKAAREKEAADKAAAKEKAKKAAQAKKDAAQAKRDAAAAKKSTRTTDTGATSSSYD